jgi:hypothetical protein
MLERTLAVPRSNSLSPRRLRTRSFHAWSGAALSRYFHKSDKPEPQPESSGRENEPSTPSSDEEMTARRAQLQEILQRVNADRTQKQKTG